jgi:hypothetical protein
MAKRLKKLIYAFFSSLLTVWLEDIFIVAGVGVILGTTYIQFGLTIGNYLLGLILIIFGFLLAKK